MGVVVAFGVGVGMIVRMRVGMGMRALFGLIVRVRVTITMRMVVSLFRRVIKASIERFFEGLSFRLAAGEFHFGGSVGAGARVGRDECV